MQNIEVLQEIDLTKGTNSHELINDAAQYLGSISGKNAAVKLKLANIQINQSQMVFIKSLVESYGHRLAFVETSNSAARDICLELGINTTNQNYKNSSIRQENRTGKLQNAKLEDLREEFKQGLESSAHTNTDADAIPSYEISKNRQESSVLEETFHEATLGGEPIEAVTVRQSILIDPQKQTIGVYRKADAQENWLEFQNGNVDFYAAPIDEPVVIDNKNTIYVNQTLRSGQVLDYEGNVVIIGDCHPGSEIKATGDITVWGVLGSIAHAGIKGNRDARIRALKMNALQLRIANCYSRSPDDGNIPYLVKSSVFTPEEARIVDDNIVLFKMAQ